MNYRHYIIFVICFVLPMSIMLFIINNVISNQKIIIGKQTKVETILRERTVRFERIENKLMEIENAYGKK